MKVTVSTRNNLYSSNYRMGPSTSKTPPKQEPLLEKPWRSHQIILENGWTKKVRTDLLDDIAKKLEGKHINVAFVGPVGSGKSSLINSYFTTVLDRITSKVKAGAVETSFTLFFDEIKGEKNFKNISFYDTMGIEETAGRGLRTKHANAIAKGEVPLSTKLDADSVDYVENKELFQHCIVFVLDGENILNGLKEDLISKISEVKNELREIKAGPNRIVIVTHIDSLCPAIKDDITKVFESKAADKVIKRASTITGVTVGQVFPVKNYVAEQDADERVNILLLLALQRIVDFSIDAISGSTSDNFSANVSQTMD